MTAVGCFWSSVGRHVATVQQLRGNLTRRFSGLCVRLESGAYCLSYTATLLTLCPAAFVPVVVTVLVLPSVDTTLVFVE